MKPVRVLIVDDSASMRALIAHSLLREPSISIVGEASDPFEAREAIKALNPDVMTLDVEMPRMDGISFLDKVMRLRPLPVIMVSSLTANGTRAAIAAMEIGAVDCIGKPTPQNPGTLLELPGKVMAAASARLERRSAPPAGTSAGASYEPDGKLVAIGASTGGVEALISIISAFPPNCPPTLVTIHMPQAFTGSFARRLDSLSAAKVLEAIEGAPIDPGVVYVARGGVHLGASPSGRLRCKLQESDPINGHRPSVDFLFDSVARARGASSVGVILTGMGRDGARGLLSMREAGASTLGQDEASCVVFGMPKAASEIGAVERLLPLDKITTAILDKTSLKNKRK